MMSVSQAVRITAALVFGVLFFLNAQSASADVFERCASDIEKYCSQVKPGDGRLAACLYAHEDKISDDCDAAVQDVSDLLDLFFDRLRYVLEQCRDDIQANCADLKVGGGRIYSCLVENSSKISAGCQDVIKQIKLPEQ